MRTPTVPLTAPHRLLAALLTPALATGPVAAMTPPAVVDAGPARAVIVVLADQHDTAGGRLLADRAARITADQQPMLTDLRRAGATRVAPFRLVNAIATTLPERAVAELATRPGVRAVLPDAPLRLRQPVAPTRPAPPTGGTAAGARSCAGPDEPPLTEPEGLALTRTVGSPGAHDLADGSGVRVGVLGGAIDPAAAEFVRDGRSVVAGYADFTGDGLDAPSYILESFGDASVVAAQGVGVYDAGRYAHPAHRPDGPCPMRILGVAPAATVHVAKVFSNVAAPTSVVLQGIEWAVLHERVDVLNESLVGYGYPDTAANALRLANDAAVAAGVTVVVATGDAGPDDTLGSPASDPDVIAVGASTQLRAYGQLGYGGSPLGDGGHRSESVSALSSGGTAQEEPRTVDLVAPGDTGWAACSTDTARYQSCVSFFDGGTPSPFFLFGGTSAAAPFVAGAAALVIQTVRRHTGATPTPEQVKRILMSSATDLRQPAAQQGAGRVDTLAAVRLAAALADHRESAARPAEASAGAAGRPASGDAAGLLVATSTAHVTGAPGQATPVAVHLTNPGGRARRVTVGLRSTAPARSLADGQVTPAAGAGTAFVDSDGVPANARRVPVTVPGGTDQIQAAVAWDPRGHTAPVAVSVFDPAGRLAGYSLPLGNGGYGRVTVARPQPGRWTVAIWTRDDGTPPVGPVRYDVSALRLTTRGGPSVVVPPGGTRTAWLPVRLPTTAGDSSAAVTVVAGATGYAALPLGLRALVPTGPAGGSFGGTFSGGNGALAGWALLGQRRSFQLDVPAGKPALAVSVHAGDDPRLEVWGLLVDPSGMPLAASSSRSAGATAPPRLDLVRRAPQPGRWTVVLVLTAPTATVRTGQPFRGRVGFAPASVVASGVPTGAALPAGRPAESTLTITNTGTAPASYLVDARLDAMGEVPLRPVASATYQTPVSAVDVYPRFAVPTGTTRLRMSADSAVPHVLDTQPYGEDGYYVGDPDLAGAAGRHSEVLVSSTQVSATTWICNANRAGPFGGAPQPPARVDCAATALTRLFDRRITSSTGSHWRRVVDGSTEPTTPLTLAPGQSGRVTVLFGADGPVGDLVTGSLTVTTLDARTGFGTEVAAVPYAYRVHGGAVDHGAARA
ncbi:S8 family serine peptidase [Micromonospora sp. NPDC005203]|uniref:S8 family serine peptidase n=1 Tax=Micromonospora sp. NPDC005203 TaxID=3364226 RepID=UPI0036B842EB